MLWWYSTMYKNRTRERESFVQDIYILLCYSTRVRTIIASAAVRENKVYLINSSKDKIRAFLKSSIYLKLRYKLSQYMYLVNCFHINRQNYWMDLKSKKLNAKKNLTAYISAKLTNLWLKLKEERKII